MSSTRGLETIRHSAPSILDIHTLYWAKGKLPEVFLRGCGLPEEFIERTRGLFEHEFFSCFISYSHADKYFAEQVHDSLQGQGIRCYLDEKQINIGDEFATEINRGIRLWDKFIICCSEMSLTSYWVDRELSTALEKEEQLYKQRGEKVLTILPLDLDGYLLAPEYTGSHATELRRRLAGKFQGWETDNAFFEAQIERVIKALRSDGGKEPPPESKL